jgi:MFS superfamily sulfate permease-like transporter
MSEKILHRVTADHLMLQLPAAFAAMNRYTSLMPPFLYMLLGTCNQISFGVTAIEALFLGESVRGVLGDHLIDSKHAADIDLKVKYTLFLSFLVGIWQIAFRVFNLGFVSSLLADPVMSGFSTGGAFIIATSQLASLLGIKLRQTDFLPANWRDACKQADEWNWCAIGMGFSGLALLYTLQVQQAAAFAR